MGTEIGNKPHTSPLVGDEKVPLSPDGYATTQEIADLSSGGSGLPSQWTDGGHGDVIATVDAPTATPIAIEGARGQSGALFSASASGNNAFAHDVGNQQTYTAAPTGTLGNGIAIHFVDNAANQAFGITDDGVSVITITLATDPVDTITSTIGDIHDGLNSYVGTVQATSVLDGGANPADLAVNSGTLGLIGGLDGGQAAILPGGAVRVLSGDPETVALYVQGDQAGVQNVDLFIVTCNGYGIQVDKHGTLIVVNDETNPSAQFWVNDGVDLAVEICGTGDVNLLLATKGIVLKDRSDGHTYRIISTNGVLSTEQVT